MTLDQDVAEVVVPGPSQVLDLSLQLLIRNLRDLDARVHVNREEDAGDLRLPE